jgi:hypothetical protein
MKEITVSSWEECQTQFKILEQHRTELRKDDDTYISPILYRGQANSKWRLETTLERYIRKNKIYIPDYYEIISCIRSEIESFTEKKWELESLSGFKDWEENQLHFNHPSIEYIVYLRHHGFPSPLLDWTKSAYIAIYYAFCNVAAFVETVSIYAFIEFAGTDKLYITPSISTVGPNIRTHHRHFRQQSQYTYCVDKDKNGNYYSCHENVFLLENKEESQDLLWKINIPITERIKVLSHLDSMNINAFTLFGSEESLMSTLALREFHLKNQAF